MKYLALVLRIVLVLIWVRILVLNGFTPWSIETCTAVWFIVTWAYLALQAIVWPKALLCPFGESCKTDSWK